MRKPFRTLLLAAGLGTRLRPITLRTPKCLVKINGEPLLGRWLRKLEEAGCESVIINTHYLAEEVERFLDSREVTRMKIQTFHEPELLGTAGTLMANKEFFRDKTGLLIHADNYMEGELSDFLNAHDRRNQICKFTMLTFKTDKPSSCGIVEIDEDGIAKAFYEKQANPPGNKANGAIYAFENEFLENLNRIVPRPNDFSIEVIPKFIGAIQTWNTKQAYIDIGTPETLIKAQKLQKK